jgi:hypothetical protein
MMSIEETAATWRFAAKLLSARTACSASPVTRSPALALRVRAAGTDHQTGTPEASFRDTAFANGVDRDYAALDRCR